MSFHALDVSLELARSVGTVLRRVRRHDRDLATQLQRAVASTALNLGEASRRAGNDRLHQFRIASGSAAESAAALRLALALGYVSQDEVRPSLGLVDRVLAMLWKLTH